MLNGIVNNEGQVNSRFDSRMNLLDTDVGAYQLFYLAFTGFNAPFLLFRAVFK